MIAPDFFDVREEVKRVRRAAPEMVRQAAFLRENPAFAAQLKAQLIANAAKIIGDYDRVNEWLHDTPPEDPLDVAAIREETAEHRKEAMALMEDTIQSAPGFGPRASRR